MVETEAMDIVCGLRVNLRITNLFLYLFSVRFAWHLLSSADKNITNLAATVMELEDPKQSGNSEIINSTIVDASVLYCDRYKEEMV